MLVRWVVTVWSVWLGAIGLATALTALQISNRNPILPVGLSVLMLAAGKSKGSGLFGMPNMAVVGQL